MKKILLSGIALSTLLQAAPLGLKTQTEFGFIKNTGNTVDETMALDATINKEWQKHIVNVKMTGQYGTENNVETKNKWLVELTYDYKFTDIFAFNYLFGFKADKFSTYEYQLYTGPGAKTIPLKSETQNLSMSANILYSQDTNHDIYENGGTVVEYPYPSGSVKKESGETKDYTGYRVALNYDLQMLENLKFTQELNYRGEFKETENYFIYSKTALSSKISDYFSAGISYVVDFMSVPNPGKEHADKTFVATLIVNY